MGRTRRSRCQRKIPVPVDVQSRDFILKLHNLAIKLGNEALKHHEQKNSKHAQAVYQGSVDTCEKIHNRHVVYTLLTLGEVKANLGGWAGDKTESRPVWQLYSKGNMYPWALEVLKLAEMNSNARQGRNHSDLISIWQTMAMVLENMNNFTWAVDLWRKSLVLLTRQANTDEARLTRLQVRLHIAELLCRDGKHDQSLALYRELLPLVRNNPKTKTYVLMCLNNMGIALRRLGREEEAQAMFAEAVRTQSDGKLPEQYTN